MSLSNATDRYGLIARSLHWLTAALILTNFPLGLIANDLPYDTAEALAQKAQLFSYHKTIGVAAAIVAALRILWALMQTRPAGLHPERRLETMLAEAVHWTLYISLVAVPLTGWVSHAAATGYAPILWPLGQGLPFVPLSESVAMTAGAMHWLFTKLLAVSLILHIAGALKHHLIDRDATLRRMWRGTPASPAHKGHQSLLPVAIAALVYISGAAIAVSLIETTAAEPEAQIASAGGNWHVQTGSLIYTVSQMGTDVDGTFASWTADITYDEPTRAGSVTVVIDTTSLTLGTVTPQAKTTEFFNTIDFPTATFTAIIAADPANPEALIADGTLALRGATLPLQLPFSLTIDGDTATMTGKAKIDRRGYQIGLSYPDEASVGFEVDVTVTLTATRT